MVPLQAVAVLLVAVGAVATVACRDVTRQAIVFSVYSLTLVALFVILQAPDVALSELVVGGVAYPIVLAGAIARVRARAKHRGEEQP